MKYGKGFTVVELLVVMGLLGILLSAALVVIDPVTQFKKGHDAKRKSDLRQIQSALELYRADQGLYPSSLYSVSCPPPSGPLSAPFPGTTVYMQQVPCDPTNKTNYTYNPSGCPSCNTYTLSTCLENTKDIEQDTVNSAACIALGRVSYILKNP